ncbi:hypothetical protein G9A89_022058 [Geosiphon pyriformis]|nr:hypothetical protein G9A89_022058 [Geosiphon pyriformis]
MASTLVSDATFKIKLAYVKAVFQLIHGFLDAKSVSKDNVKLFCLTSFVHLVTLKIVKSLVISEFGSPSAAVALCDVPLGVSAANIKTAFSVFGSVTCVVLKSAGIWQYVVVYFEKLDSAVSALNHWSVLIGKNSVRILPLVNQQDTIVSCNRFKTKLVNFLPGCTAFEISDMISQVGADLDFAIVKTSMLRKCHIWWETPGCQHCFRCQETGHLIVNCKMSLSSSSKTPKVFNLYFVNNVFYAKVSALLNGSGFSPLVAFDLLAPPFVAFFAASIADFVIELRLNFMKKQILDLTALIKSVIEPIGFLVTLITALINNNTVKALKIEKNFLTICNASKGFANLLVGVFKDFASFKAEVEFGNLDDDNFGAAKAFPLSEDTVDCAVALWQMCGPKVKSSSEKTRLFFNGFIFDSKNLNGIIKRLGKLDFLPASFDLA